MRSEPGCGGKIFLMNSAFMAVLIDFLNTVSLLTSQDDAGVAGVRLKVLEGGKLQGQQSSLAVAEVHPG